MALSSAYTTPTCICACTCMYAPTETVPEECQGEVYDFMIVRGKNINANLPLGEG